LTFGETGGDFGQEQKQPGKTNNCHLRIKPVIPPKKIFTRKEYLEKVVSVRLKIALVMVGSIIPISIVLEILTNKINSGQAGGMSVLVFVPCGTGYLVAVNWLASVIIPRKYGLVCPHCGKSLALFSYAKTGICPKCRASIISDAQPTDEEFPYLYLSGRNPHAPRHQPMSQAEINQQEWENPANWGRLTYSSRADSRMFVPKRIPLLGWTLNFGNPKSKYVLLAFLAIPAFYLVLALAGGKKH